MNWFEQHWQTLAASFGSLSLGGVLVKLWEISRRDRNAQREHKRKSREASDHVALDLVRTLAQRVEELEKSATEEREACASQLAALRKELSEMSADMEALLLAIELAPEKAAEAVARIRDARERKKNEVGNTRQALQVSASAKHNAEEGIHAPVAQHRQIFLPKTLRDGPV